MGRYLPRAGRHGRLRPPVPRVLPLHLDSPLIGPGPSTRVRGRRVSIGRCPVSCCWPWSSSCSPRRAPGAQEFGPLTPADGASVPVNPDGIPVTFSCPPYGLFGGPTSYGATLSTSAGARPRRPARRRGRARQRPRRPVSAGPVRGALGAGGPPPRIQETPGSYYWQVWRICAECPTSYETAPVRTLTLQSPVEPTLSVPRKAYAGYASSPPWRSRARRTAPPSPSSATERAPAAAPRSAARPRSSSRCRKAARRCAQAPRSGHRP